MADGDIDREGAYFVRVLCWLPLIEGFWETVVCQILGVDGGISVK